MEIKEITDKIQWEAFLQEFSPQSLFQSWNWGEVVKKSGTLVWRKGVYSGNTLQAVAQITRVNAKRGVFLHVRHGPIFSEASEEVVLFFFTYLKQFGKDQKAVFIRVSPLIANTQDHISLLSSVGAFDAPIHQMDGEYCWVLDITKKEEELFGGMRKTTRYLIRQAEKMGVVIEKTSDKKHLNEFITLYKRTATRHHFIAHKGIQEEYNQFSKENEIELFRGVYQDKLISGALILFYNNQAIYHHSASIPQKIPVNYLLQWEAIKEAMKRKKTVYNFWGVSPETEKNHPWHGLSQFKRGFGGHLIEYLHAKDIPLSPLYCATYAIETFRKWKKGY